MEKQIHQNTISGEILNQDVTIKMPSVLKIMEEEI